MRSVTGIILGAGPNSEGGDLPPGLMTLDGDYSVLHWIDSALKSYVKEPINFIGGYRIKDIAQKHPHFAYTLNPEWEYSGVLESLYHARTCMSKCFIVSYSDIVYRRSVVESLLGLPEEDIVIATTRDFSASGTKNRVTIGQEGTLKNIGFLSSSREVNGQFTGLTLFQNSGASLAQQFFREEYATQRNQPFEQAKKLKNGYLTDFLRFGLAKGLKIRCVDVTGDWSEVNQVSSLAKFVLGTKGETLQRMMPVLQKSKVPELEYFTVADWQQEPDWILTQIDSKFSREKIAIRSSSLLEDGWKNSGAGQFLSVLKLAACDKSAVAKAIDQVIASYHCQEADNGHQFIVQTMVEQVYCSGVVFTATLESGAPYYVVNYELSDKTDGITSGTAEKAKLVYVRKSSVRKKLPHFLNKLLLAVDEIESKVAHHALDIEFALDKLFQVHILQVRPIAVSFQHQISLDEHQQKVQQLKNNLEDPDNGNSGLLGGKTLYSNMADWNPAEMIGARSQPLSLSLYHHLIMQSTWAQARQALGYKDVSQFCLMKVLAGRPFIDLRLSFNSYLPANLPVKLGKKLVDAWLQRVRSNPSLHDKVEFDVAYTCWYFDFESKYQWLKQAQFSSEELHNINLIYKQHTTELLHNYREIAAELDLNFKKLEDFRHQVNGCANGLNSAIALLDKCRDLGTFSFSIYARWAFVGTTLLRSLIRCGVLSENRGVELENSVHTVASELQEEHQKLQAGEILLDEFMSQYGHLRPGAYDICADRYDAMKDVFLTHNASRGASLKVPFSFTDEETDLINNLFETHLNFSSQEFMQFFHFAVSQREYGKFIFTRSLSDALEHIKNWGKASGFSPENLRYLTIQNLMQSGYLGASDCRHYIQQQVQAAQTIEESDKSILLPDLICQPDDFDVFKQHDCKPNFVTREQVVAEVIHCQQNTKAEELDNKIVFVESADPGFDWIFTRNIKGLVTRYGGAASHMTIRAAEFGLPAAIGCGGVIFDSLKNCKAISLDCATETLNAL